MFDYFKFFKLCFNLLNMTCFFRPSIREHLKKHTFLANMTSKAKTYKMPQVYRGHVSSAIIEIQLQPQEEEPREHRLGEVLQGGSK